MYEVADEGLFSSESVDIHGAQAEVHKEMLRGEVRGKVGEVRVAFPNG